MSEGDGVAKCSLCGRERTPEDQSYNPISFAINGEIGWYSGSDGEICTEDFADMMKGANGR